MLISVAIISVLLALAAPVLWRMAAQGKQVRCAANLRQISTLFNSYLADNRYKYPLSNWQENQTAPYRFWAETLIDYIGDKALLSAFICPGVKRDDLNPDLRNLKGGYAYVSYGINRYGVAPAQSDTPYLHAAVQTVIEEPSRVLLLMDMEVTNQPGRGWYSAHYTFAQDNWSQIERRHKVVNALFCDGHVRPVSLQEMNPVSNTEYPWRTYQNTLYR